MMHFKGLGVVTLALAIALLSVGSSSAGAAPTVLCKIEESPCPEINQWKNTSFETTSSSFELRMGMPGIIKCTGSTLKGALGAPNEPQAVAIEKFTFTGCKRGTETCTVSAPSLGGLDLLRTGPNSGEATLLNTEITSQCGLFIDCKFEGEPVAELWGKEPMGNAFFRFVEVLLTKVGGAACPTTKLNGTYNILTPLPVYIQSP